jgi:hypothetical protein
MNLGGLLKDSLESVLSDTLLTNESTEKMVESILARLRTNNHKNIDRKPLIQFLIHAGYWQEVLELYGQWFETSAEEIPLHEYVHVLKLAKIKPNKDFLNHLEKANFLAQEKNRVQYCENWDATSMFLQESKNNWVSHTRRIAKEAYEQWISQIQYLQSQRMILEEEKLLKVLITVYPDDKFIKEQIVELKERKALHTISENSVQVEGKALQKFMPRWSDTEIQMANILLNEEQKICKKNPAYAYNFAIGFYFMELYEYALEILEFAPSSPAADWLYPEILIHSERYIECLDCLESIENKYAHDPETTFAVTYYRAIALQGVGQISQACELLKSLVSVRPHYRSSHEFLLKWAGVS